MTVAKLVRELSESYCSNNSKPLVSIWSQINPLHYSHPISLTSYDYYFLVHVWISQVLSSRRFLSSNPTLYYSAPNTCYMPGPSHPAWFRSPNEALIISISIVILTTNGQMLGCATFHSVSGAHHDDSHCPDLSIRLSVCSFQVQLCSLTPCSRTTSTWALPIRLMVFERRILRKIYGPTQDIDGTWRRKTNEELEILIRNKILWDL